MDLSAGWRFQLGDEPESVTQPGFDDGHWSTVRVPHSWNHLGEYAPTRSGQTNNTQGIGWYRLSLAVPVRQPGTRQYLDFAAVSKIADVWVNGVHVGQHKGAFARFRFDVTSVLRPGERNLIAVRVDNSKAEPGSSTAETIPLAGDFFVHGGIYRSVALVTTSDAGFDLLDFGGPGIYARAASITSEKAEIAVLARLRNSGTKTRAMSLTMVIRDAAGLEVARSVSPVRLGTGPTEQALTLSVPAPHLWNGTADPYLYSITSELTERGHVLDRETQPLGIRTFAFDPDKGFSLNGAHVKLHGVSRHQDRPDKGWALTPADAAEDMAMIREMGANTIRQAHYQHADEWSDEADRAGMVVWAELPYVTSPTLGSGKGSAELWANADQQLRELIRQDYNHPAITMWSVGNEVDSGKGFGVVKDPANPLPLLQHLNALAKQEDPSRATTFADCCEDLGIFQTGGEKLAGTADLIGYNRYFGWYMPKPLDARAQFAAQLDKLHIKHPQLPISISEYGAGGAVSQHSDDIAGGFLNFTGRPQPEEFESFVHEQTWPVIRERDYVFASWIWNMFDFASGLREEGDSFDINTKGLVTADRKVKKDAFYYYKAQWNPEPMIHLNGKRYAVRAYPVMDVRAYSNAERATLTVNGKPVGEAGCPDHICKWPRVALLPGPNHAVVTATVGSAAIRDEADWTGPDPALGGIHLDAGNLGGRTIGGRIFGSDTFVTGGTAMVLNMGGFGGRHLAPPRSVAAPDPELYEYWREGDRFSYAVPVPDGRWTVTVHTFEPRPDPGDVTMQILANGREAVKPFSVLKQAGGALRGITRTFPVKVVGGVLALDFVGKGGKAVVAAIEIGR